MMKRQSGVLMPIFSLPGKYGCGTFGKNAYKWIDCLSKGGFSCWQVLPFGITDSHNSPYMSYSSFAGNPYFIDPSELLSMGLVTTEEEQAQIVSDKYLCRYDILQEKRYRFLKTAASRVKDKTAIMDFFENNPRIRDTCTFLALKQSNGNCPWNEWTTSTPDPNDLFAWQFIQYEFHRQWKNVQSYAAQKISA